ncbi:MAG: peptidase, partial [Acidobacteria bacterium]|nr:peptidase [Acidobacteriota bacterium]
MKNGRTIVAALLLSALLAPVTLAGAKIRIQNNDGPNEGFNDPAAATPVGGNAGTTIGAQRLIAFQRAAEIWAGILDSDVEIVIDARFDPLECDSTGAVLGSAGPRWIESDFPGAPVAATWYHGALVNRLAGEDRDPTTNEINARFNVNLGQPNCLPNRGWYYGLDNNHGTQIDLIVVLLHEFGHGLGFSEFVDSDTGEFFDGQVDAYASFLFDNTTGKRWSQMSNSERLQSAVNDGQLVLDGPSVSAASAAFFTGVNGTRLTVNDPPSIAKSYVASRGTVGGPIGSGISGTFILA